MSLVVVGGHSRNIGKTSLACRIISLTPELNWTGLKISLYGHGVCSSSGKPCGCTVDDPDHPFAVSEERHRAGATDTARMLQAGAARAFWARAPQGRLEQAIPVIREVLDESGWVVVESNTLLDFIRPALYVAVLDYAVEDFKPSARRHLARADAFVLVNSDEQKPPWPWFDVSLLETRPVFAVQPPRFESAALDEWMRAALRVVLSPPVPA